MSTAITIPAGKTTHITVDDEDGKPLPPTSITFVQEAGLDGLLTVERDETGFNLAAASGASADGSASVTFTYHGGGVDVVMELDVTIGRAVAGPLSITTP